MASSTRYSFEKKIASCYVFKETAFNNAKEGDNVRVDLKINKLSKNVDPYARVIRVKYQLFNSWKAVGYILRDISRHVNYFIKTEGGFVNRSVIPTRNRPSGGLEILLLLKCLCLEQKMFEKTLLIVFMITITVELTAKTAVMKNKLEFSLKLISQNQSVTVADQSKLISYTDRSSEAVSGSGNFDEPIDLTIN